LCGGFLSDGLVIHQLLAFPVRFVVGVLGNRNRGGHLLWLVVLEKILKLLERAAGHGNGGVKTVPDMKMDRGSVEGEVLQGVSVAQGTDTHPYAVVVCVVLVGLGVPQVMEERKLCKL